MGLRDDMEYGQYRREKIIVEMGQRDKIVMARLTEYASNVTSYCESVLDYERLGPVAEQRIHDFRLALEEAMKILRGDDE
jgi:hypothetical protein